MMDIMTAYYLSCRIIRRFQSTKSILWLHDTLVDHVMVPNGIDEDAAEHIFWNAMSSVKPV